MAEKVGETRPIEVPDARIRCEREATASGDRNRHHRVLSGPEFRWEPAGALERGATNQEVAGRSVAWESGARREPFRELEQVAGRPDRARRGSVQHGPGDGVFARPQPSLELVEPVG